MNRRLTTFTTIAAGILFLALIAAAHAQVNTQESSQDISDRLASRQEYLEQNRQQLADLSLQIAASEQYLDQRRTELADATSRLRDAEDRYDETLRLYEGRIAAIYKLGEGDFYAVVLASEDFSDAVSRISLLTRVSENDQHLVDRVKGEAEYVRQLHEKVDELKQAQAVDVTALKLRKQQLEGQITTDQADIDRQLKALAEAQAREQQEADRLAAEAASYEGSSMYADMLASPVSFSNEPPAGLRPTGIVMNGIASWYGPGFQGNTTANGEIYDMYGYTAAHKSLPFNTWLKVSHNGRAVFVRINDRGPYVGGRILDLSLSSARAIGISGIGPVTAEIYR